MTHEQALDFVNKEADKLAFARESLNKVFAHDSEHKPIETHVSAEMRAFAIGVLMRYANTQ